MSLSGVVADLGCPGVDVDAFKASCRVPMYPEKWNRWLLLRTASDNPTAMEIERSTVAVLGKWFELVEQPGGYSKPGMADVYTPSRGYVDNLRIRLVPADWPSAWGRTVARREQCNPIPMLKPGGVLGVAVEFVYRGQQTSLPWPVHTAAVIGRYCPVGADWMLSRAYAPPATAVPKEKTALDEAGTAISNVARALLPNPVGLIVFALAGLGVVLASKAIRR